MTEAKRPADVVHATMLKSAVIRQFYDAREKIAAQLSQVIVGQAEVIEELLICLSSRGHCLLEGVPDLPKTLMIGTLARTLNLSFGRVHFTPDLMPADITGTEILEENRFTGARERRFLEGPLFSNIILADVINRTPPKNQAVPLEAMQERQATVGRVRHPLSDPFFVLPTQNTIEQEGPYPLPEARQDRFMFKVFINYPNLNEEFEIARRRPTVRYEAVGSVLSGHVISVCVVADASLPVSSSTPNRPRSDQPLTVRDEFFDLACFCGPWEGPYETKCFLLPQFQPKEAIVPEFQNTTRKSSHFGY